MAKTKSDLIERTAIADYRLNGELVRKGQIRPLTRAQIETLAAAGCVHADDAKNAEAEVTSLEPTAVPELEPEADRIAREQAEAEEAAKKAAKSK